MVRVWGLGSGLGSVLVMVSTALAQPEDGNWITAQIANTTSTAFLVYSFHGEDTAGEVPYHSYTMQPGETQFVNCQGQGQDSCLVYWTYPAAGQAYRIRNQQICEIESTGAASWILKTCD